MNLKNFLIWFLFTPVKTDIHPVNQPEVRRTNHQVNGRKIFCCCLIPVFWALVCNSIWKGSEYYSGRTIHLWAYVQYLQDIGLNSSNMGVCRMDVR